MYWHTKLFNSDKDQVEKHTMDFNITHIQDIVIQLTINIQFTMVEKVTLLHVGELDSSEFTLCFFYYQCPVNMNIVS